MTELFQIRQVAAVIALAVVAGCVPALQPILLGGLLAEGRLGVEQVGLAGTLEGLGMLVGTLLATMILRPTQLRGVAGLGAVAIASANLATTIAPAGGILLARCVNGAASGVLLWLLTGLVTRAAAPGRLFAIYVTTQAAAAFLLSLVFALVVVPRFGVAGGYLVLAVLGLALLVPGLMLIPRSYRPLAAAGHLQLPSGRGLIGIAAVACYLSGVMAFWVYFTPLANSLGHGAGETGKILSLAIGVQIAGGLCATGAAGRLNGAVATMAGAAISAGAVLATLAFGGDYALLFGLACLFTFCWMFVPPFQLPLLLDLDPSGRTATFIGVAQLSGLSIGPLLASQCVTAKSFGGAALASAALFAACILLTGLALLLSGRDRPGLTAAA